MFQVGDTICYPMHGVGRVEGMEEREMGGENTLYYVLYFFNEGIKVSVPVDRAEIAGLRSVINSEEVDEVYAKLRERGEKGDTNWNRRYRINLDKLRDGSALSVATVVKSLSVREKKRALSAGEKKMLVNARRILVSELATAGAGDEEHINETVDECIGTEE